MKRTAILFAWPFLLATLTAAQPTPQAGQSNSPFSRYEMEIKVDPDGHRLEGRGTVWVPALDEPRESLNFGLAESMRNFVVEVLEPEESAGPVTLEKGLPGGRSGWVVRPGRPFPAGRPIRLRLAWQGGEQPSFVFYLGPEGSFASGINTAWYPIPPRGLATGTLRIDVPVGLRVHANGVQRGSEEQRTRGVFQFENNTPSFFAFTAAKYTVTRYDGAIPVSVYSFKPRSGASAYVDGARKAIDVLTKEFGPYPSGEFAIVEVPTAQAKTAGFSGASVTGFIMVTAEYLDQSFNLAYYGHEIAHQWWGNLVRHTGTRGRMMMDEAMAQFGSLRVVETLEGAAAAERYRRTGYPGYIDDQSGLGYLRVLAAGRDFPLSNIPADASRSLADGKGFQIWDLLARTIGRERFSSILSDFTRQRAFQTTTWDEFLQAIQIGAGRNLQWFYDQWFERPGAPEWHLDWRQEGAMLRGVVTQDSPYFGAELEVRVDGDGTQTETVMVEVDGPRTEFTLQLPFSAKRVLLDPSFHVLRWTPEYRANTAPSPTK